MLIYNTDNGNDFPMSQFPNVESLEIWNFTFSLSKFLQLNPNIRKLAIHSNEQLRDLNSRYYFIREASSALEELAVLFDSKEYLSLLPKLEPFKRLKFYFLHIVRCCQESIDQTKIFLGYTN